MCMSRTAETAMIHICMHLNFLNRSIHAVCAMQWHRSMCGVRRVFSIIQQKWRDVKIKENWSNAKALQFSATCTPKTNAKDVWKLFRIGKYRIYFYYLFIFASYIMCMSFVFDCRASSHFALLFGAVELWVNCFWLPCAMCMCEFFMPLLLYSTLCIWFSFSVFHSSSHS